MSKVDGLMSWSDTSGFNPAGWGDQVKIRDPDRSNLASPVSAGAGMKHVPITGLAVP